MELRQYIRILQKRWWVIVIGTAIVTIASVVFVYVRPTKYAATATMLVSPASTLLNNSEVRASLDVLDKPIVVNTYAEIAQSNRIKSAAWIELEVPTTDPERREYEIRSNVRQETNIIEVSAEGADAKRATEVANAVANQTLIFVSNLHDVYDLSFLDYADISYSPVGLGDKLAILVGLVLGLGLGVIGAFLIDYLLATSETLDNQIDAILEQN